MILGAWVDRLFNKHKLVRRGLVIWAVWLITVVVLRVVDKITEVNSSVQFIVLGVIGILTTVIGFYQWSRGKDGEGE